MRLAREARDAAAGPRPVAVAGSISIWDPPRSFSAARAAVAEQAGILADGGADLVALEMIISTDEAAAAIEGVREAGLPVWLGLSVRLEKDGRVLLLREGEPLDAALASLVPLRPDAILIMHSLPEATGPALRILRGAWDGPAGAYAHMGEFTMPDWRWERPPARGVRRGGGGVGRPRRPHRRRLLRDDARAPRGREEDGRRTVRSPAISRGSCGSAGRRG
jgi:S-methylmethionine-dependent homocysteine/selenocysteine methylase